MSKVEDTKDSNIEWITLEEMVKKHKETLRDHEYVKMGTYYMPDYKNYITEEE